MSAANEEKVKQRAYELWLEEGQPEGRHDEHWQRASSELEGSSKRDKQGSPDKESNIKIKLVAPTQEKTMKKSKKY